MSKKKTRPIEPSQNLRKAIEEFARQTRTAPVARARLLAAQILDVANLLERQREQLETELRPELAAVALAEVARPIYKAWLAFHGLDEKRHERLALVEAVKTASEMLQALDRQFPRSSIDDGRIPLIAEIARTFYAVNFPKRAPKVDTSLLTTAILAWPNEAGRLKPGEIGKWAAINEVAKAAGLPATAPRTIQREWVRHAHELELGNPWNEKPPNPKR